MAKRAVELTSHGTDQGAIIHNLGQRFKVVTNIRRPDIHRDKERGVLELEGKADDIERGIACVTGQGGKC